MALIECSGCGEELDVSIMGPRGVRQISHSDGTVSILQGEEIVHCCEKLRSEWWHQLPLRFLASGQRAGQPAYRGHPLD
jgi:hypothetical protein